MARFRSGDSFNVPCVIEPGAFPDEKRVTIRRASGKGDLCGYVPREQVQFTNQNRGFVRGTVVDVKTDCITVQISGSFSTASGHAALRIRYPDAHSRSRTAA
ncbi:MAG: hypothetical protein GWN84_00985 [Gammaproteobacteria bacterium]|nr:hypothetical protein [Gammaproteobacteria bacterium]NIR81771.1 hypothetical protein [Gammaproteobacteria bacterium]NIR88574.1 hypothetical protein [Gammaproteobacteria bacterium]NIU02878.1 hypothetical protein [Gammaproteobacteria bacterium]NIV50400.1 hypothetical protein [Gammaproteobacteria bacterium]